MVAVEIGCLGHHLVDWIGSVGRWIFFEGVVVDRLEFRFALRRIGIRGLRKRVADSGRGRGDSAGDLLVRATNSAARRRMSPAKACA